MSGGVDSEALKVPRQLFSSARNIEGERFTYHCCNRLN